jgi:hypothetical protein
VRGAEAISLWSTGFTWLQVAHLQGDGQTAQQAELDAAYSAAFLVKAARPSGDGYAHFRKAFGQIFRPEAKRAHEGGPVVSRVLLCAHPDGGLMMCGCIAAFGAPMEQAVFTPIFHARIRNASGPVEQFHVANALLRASLDAQSPSRGEMISRLVKRDLPPQIKAS